MATHKIGAIEWLDMTVPNALDVRDFYQKVIGWTCTSVPMGGYDDYCMNTPEDNQTVSGICHKQGPNTHIPAGWIPYITVANLDLSLQQCQECGGQMLGEVRTMGTQGRYAFIQDPAGAVCALYEHLS